MDFSKEELTQKHAPIKSRLLNECPVPPLMGSLCYPHEVSSFGIMLLQHVRVATLSPATPQRRSLSAGPPGLPRCGRSPGRMQSLRGVVARILHKMELAQSLTNRGKRSFSSSSILTPQHRTRYREYTEMDTGRGRGRHTIG